jgi:hypothetical protein
MTCGHDRNDRLEKSFAAHMMESFRPRDPAPPTRFLHREIGFCTKCGEYYELIDSGIWPRNTSDAVKNERPSQPLRT